jgi:anaerobic selenocysteine-containing dehydrogenase
MTQMIRGECALCVMCCGVDFYVNEGRLVKVEGAKGNSVNNGSLCPKGQRIVETVYSPDRLKYPLKREGNRWSRISWDEALDSIAGKLKEIKGKYGAKAVAFFCGSIAVERIELAAFAHRFRGAYGSPNQFEVESGCYAARIVARVLTFGMNMEPDGVPSGDPGCVILWAHNPHSSRFMYGDYLDAATERGVKLIVIDPRRIPASKKGIHIQIRPGTDTALALGMLNVIITEDLYDKEFVRDWTVGFDKLEEHVKDYTPERVEEITWVPAVDIRQIARLYATSKSAAIQQGICALDRQINNLQNSRVLSILQAVTGNIDIPGAWVPHRFFPLTDLRLPVQEKPLGAEKYPLFFKRGVYNEGWAPYGSESEFVDTLITEKPYPIKGLMVSGGNPMCSTPDTQKFKKGLDKLELIVTLDLFMTETASASHFVLPASSFVELTGIGSYPVGCQGIFKVAYRPRVIEPLYESWPDWKIWSELGRRMGYGEYFPWKTDEEVTDYMLSACGVPVQEIKENPLGILYPREYQQYKKLGFPTPSGKVEIFSEAFKKAGFDPLPTHREPSQSPVSTPKLAEEYPLILITGARILEYCHSTGRRMPELRRLVPYPEVEVHPAAAAKYGVVNGEWVMVETKTGSVKFKAKVTEDIHPKVVSVPHGWGNANANILISNTAVEPIAGYPEDKALLCRIRKI